MVANAPSIKYMLQLAIMTIVYLKSINTIWQVLQFTELSSIDGLLSD